MDSAAPEQEVQPQRHQKDHHHQVDRVFGSRHTLTRFSRMEVVLLFRLRARVVAGAHGGSHAVLRLHKRHRGELRGNRPAQAFVQQAGYGVVKPGMDLFNGPIRAVRILGKLTV